MAIRFAGYAAIFDKRDRGGDVIRPGAFARTLKKRRDVPLLWQHQRGRVIGKIETLAADKRGLRVIARITDSDVATMVRKGSGLSFGYRVREGQRKQDRELLDLDLVEISVVNVPMQRSATIHALNKCSQSEPQPLSKS